MYLATSMPQSTCSASLMRTPLPSPTPTRPKERIVKMMSQESAITFWGVCSIITTIFTIFTLAAYIINRRRDEKKKREGIYISRLRALLVYVIVFIPGFPIIRYFLSLNGPETNPYAEGIYIFMTAFLLFYLWHVNATYMKISSEGINMHTPVRGSRICPIGAIDSVVYSESKDEDTPKPDVVPH